jgi:hypothetical protein
MSQFGWAGECGRDRKGCSPIRLRTTVTLTLCNRAPTKPQEPFCRAPTGFGNNEATNVNTAARASGNLVRMARPILRASVKERSYGRLAMDRGLLPTQRAVSGATWAVAPPLVLGDRPRPATVGALAPRSPGASQRLSVGSGISGQRSGEIVPGQPQPATPGLVVGA